MVFFVFCLISLLSLPKVKCYFSKNDGCINLSHGVFESALKHQITHDSFVSGTTVVSYVSVYATCLAQGTSKIRYRSGSAVLSFKKTTRNGVETYGNVKQSEVRCTNGNNNIWTPDYYYSGLSNFDFDYEHTNVWTNCSDCLVNAPNDHHCQR